MSSVHPSSQSLIDDVIYPFENLPTHYVLVILRPAANDRVELDNEFPRWQRGVLPDDVSSLLQVGLDVFLGRFNEQFVSFAVLVLADVLTEKIKPFFNMRDDRFFWGEHQPSFAHELLHKRFDLLFEEFF